MEARPPNRRTGVVASTEALSNATKSAGETIDKGVSAGVEALASATNVELNSARIVAEVGAHAGRRVGDTVSTATDVVTSSTIVVTAGDGISGAASITKLAVAGPTHVPAAPATVAFVRRPEARDPRARRPRVCA